MFFPHIFVWGSCFWLCTPAAPSRPPPHMLTNNLLTHNLPTHNFLTYNSHTTCSHNLSTHTHTLLTHNLLTHTTCSHTTCPHTTYSHTTCSHTVTLCGSGTWSLTLQVGTYGTGLALVTRLGRSGRPLSPARAGVPRLCLAGVALGASDRHFAWQAWHLETSTVTLRGRCGTYGTGLAPVARLGRSGRPLSPRLLAWQAWHLVTSTVILRGRRGTYIDRHFAWQVWHLRHWAGSHTIFDPPLCHTHHLSHTVFHTPSFTQSLCVAGLALAALGCHHL